MPEDKYQEYERACKRIKKDNAKLWMTSTSGFRERGLLRRRFGGTGTISSSTSTRFC
jgi:hypothetical protein